MSYYCYLDSDGPKTNLQLYALKKAAFEWNELVSLVADCEIDHVAKLKERLAFILNCLGLSLSQLLGQNCPSPKKDKIDAPCKLLSTILKRTSIQGKRQSQLNRTFKEFLLYYDAIRHFGENKGRKKYRTLDQLTLKELDRFRCMTIEIWDIVIKMHRNDPGNDIEKFRSVSDPDVVEFIKLA